MKLYVINLDRSKDRLEHISKIFKDENLNFNRVSAVDGRALEEDEFQRLTTKRNWPKALTRTEVGCFLSHRKCLQLIAEGNDPYGAIFEDDIALSPNAAVFLKNWDWIPENTDIVKIDTAQTPCVVGPISKTLEKGYHLAPLLNKHYCTGGYIISKSAAQKLYELTALVTAPIDEIYFNPECAIMPLLHIEQMVPAITVQLGLISTIRAPKDLNKKHIPSDRSFLQKITREWQRFEKKTFWPWRMKMFHGCSWGKIPFN